MNIDIHKFRTWLVFLVMGIIIAAVGFILYSPYFDKLKLQSETIDSPADTGNSSVTVENQPSDPVEIRRMKYTEILLRYQADLSSLEAQSANRTSETDTVSLEKKIKDTRAKIANLEALIKKLTQE